MKTIFKKIKQWRRNEVLAEFGINPGDEYFRKLRKLTKLYRKSQHPSKPSRRAVRRTQRHEVRLRKLFGKKKAQQTFKKLQQIVDRHYF